MSEYGFVELSKQLGASLLKGAEDNVAEATKLLDEVKTLVEEIQKHVEEQAKALDNASARTKAYGERVLAAHKEYINGGKHENPSP
jgi:flagellin-like hook-associated protein FlgL